MPTDSLIPGHQWEKGMRFGVDPEEARFAFSNHFPGARVDEIFEVDLVDNGSIPAVYVKGLMTDARLKLELGGNIARTARLVSLAAAA